MFGRLSGHHCYYCASASAGGDSVSACWREQVGDLDRSHPSPRASGQPGEAVMLWTIFVILLVLWLLGMVSSYTLGGFIHVLLVVAIVIALIQLIQGRRVV